MKKIFFFLAILSVFAINAQTINHPINFLKTTTGTYSITTAAPDTQNVSFSYGAETSAIQVFVTKVTGTLYGKVSLYASLDGTNYTAIGPDTLHIGNASVGTIFLIRNNPFKYYRLIGTLSSATSVATMAAKLLPTNASPIVAPVLPMKSVYNLNTDTITNTATNTMTLLVQYARKAVTIQPVLTKISGTVAGTVTLQGSIDGTNYSTVSTSYLSNYIIYGSGSAATYTATDLASQNTSWTVIGSPYLYYRVSWTGSGTMSAKMSANSWLPQ